MKEIWENIVKNKYIILFVSIVVILYALGIFEYIFRFLVLIAFIALAVFLGKKVQDNEEVINRFLNKNFKKNSGDNVYYYQEKNNTKKE